MEKYTTLAKQEAEKDKKPEEKTEKDKTILSEDAFAICDFMEQLKQGLEHLRISALRR
jgi:hypothetical protein